MIAKAAWSIRVRFGVLVQSVVFPPFPLLKLKFEENGMDDWDLTAEEMDVLERDALKQLAERKSSSVVATTSLGHNTNSGAYVPSCRSPAKPAFLSSTSLNNDKQVNASQNQRILPASLTPPQCLNDSSNQHLAKVQVKFFLHANGNVAAKFSFNQILVDAFRKIPGAIWNREERLWKFPLASLSKAESVLHDLPGINVTLESLDPIVRRAIAAAAELPNLQDRYGKIPSCIESQLMPFQRDGVRFVLQHGGRVLLADEMGLGKTLQAIAVASCFPEAWPVLVLTPSSLRLQWASMIHQWLKIDPHDILVVLSQTSGSNKSGFKIVPSNAQRPISFDCKFNIISYDIVPKIKDKLLSSGFKVVIADESHFLKNNQAKRTISTIPILQKADYVILLSGTPALSRPIELFKQLEALYPDVYKNLHEYGERYCKGGKFGLYQGSSNQEELHNLMKATLMIRRLKKDVLSELPVKRRQQVFMDLGEDKLKQITALFRELEVIEKKVKSCQSKEEVDSLTFTKKNLINKLYTDSAEAKIDAVLDYLGTVIEAGCKFLIFAHHQPMIDAIHKFLLKKKVGCIRIDGGTPAGSRQNLVKEFQETDSVKAAVLSIKAGGVGLTLTAASTVIFAELSWTPGDIIQAEDRAHRIGQESSVNVYYLLANDTVDDIIWDVVQSKLDNLGQVLDGHENCLHIDQSGSSPLGKRKFPVDELGRSPSKQSTFQADQSGSSPLKQRTLDSFMMKRCSSTSSEEEPRPKYPKH